MPKIHKKQLENSSLLKENYMRQEFFEEAVQAKITEFKMKYPKAEVSIQRNKHGARVIAYLSYEKL